MRWKYELRIIANAVPAAAAGRCLPSLREGRGTAVAVDEYAFYIIIPQINTRLSVVRFTLKQKQICKSYCNWRNNVI